MLPKFEVGIDSPDDFTLADKTAHVIVRAKYTNGKPLRGTAVVTVKKYKYLHYPGLKNPVYHPNWKNQEDLLEKTVLVDGQETVEFDIENELKCNEMKTKEYFNVKHFNIKLEVTETLTGLSQSTEKAIKVHKDTYNI